jgi:phosphate starvation-inducible PhoH-like protein
MVETSTVTFCVGPAGTGKTYMACGVAAQMLREGRIDSIIVARPLVDCDEELGFLPGDINEKVGPYVAPVMDSLSDFLTPKEMQEYVQKGKIIVVPLAVMRGRTFKRAFVIIDEAQNATFGQLRMALTRIGEGTRIVINGDIKQVDLSCKAPLIAVLRRLMQPPRNPDIALVKMEREDVMRHPLVQFLDERLCD